MSPAWPSPDRTPSISVVVPAFRRPERLRTLLTALAAQDQPASRMEVIIVDDGSPHPLAPSAAPFTAQLNVRVHRQSNAGPAVARNTGARMASGDVLVFTDDDCIPEPAWARVLAAAVAEQPTALVGGHVVNDLTTDRFAEASQQLIAFLLDWYGEDRKGAFFPSNNMAAARPAFLELEGFDESFPQPGGEDRELCERWGRHGWPLLFARDAVVHHAHAMDLAGFIRQHRNYGKGAYQVHRRRAAAEGRPMRVEPARFYARLVGYPFGRLPAGEAFLTSGLLLLSQAANAAGFVEGWLKARNEAPDGPTGPR